MKEEIQKILYTELTIEESERLTEKLLDLFNVSNSFYCQREIEMETICDKQCEHCEEYYEPLENDC